MLPDEPDEDDLETQGAEPDEPDEGDGGAEAEPEEEAEGEEADPEGEAPGEPEVTEGDGEPAPVRTKGKGAVRFQKLANENRDLKRRLEALESRPAPVDHDAVRRQQEDEARADEEIALSGDPARISQHFANKAVRGLEHRLNQVQFQTIDGQDRASFDALCARNPLYENVRDDVEDLLSAERRQGRPGASRRVLAELVIGRKAIAAAAKAKTKRGKRTEIVRQNNTTRPGNGRSDVRMQGRRGGDEKAKRAERLKTMSI